jgi:hypothetical protein
MPGTPTNDDQSFLDEIAGFGGEDERTPAQLEEQGQIEDDLEAEAKVTKPDPDEYDERDEDPAGNRGDRRGESQEDKRVPLAELVAERKARQELQRRLEALEQARQQPEAKPEPEDAEPDYLDDPKAWTEWKIRQQAREVEALKQKAQTYEQQTAEARQFQEFTQNIQAAEQNFVQTAPDYHQALAFARQRAAQDIIANAEALGVEVTQQQVIQELTRRELGVAAQAMQRGLNPAEAVYKIAKAWGFTGGQAAPNGQAGAQRPAPNRDLARGLPDGGANREDLTESEVTDSLPAEFLAARAERFGRAR